MFGNRIVKPIYKKIKKYDRIVIARHIGPDPDCLSSSIALRDSIRLSFPNKEVIAVGNPTSRFRYLGTLDNFDTSFYKDALLIVVDTPDKKRVDGVDPTLFKDSVKIDHHPYVESFCDYEWIDEDSSSAAQMVMELIFEMKLKMTKEIAEKLYVGLISDTDRFLFIHTTPKTFNLVARLIRETDIDITKLYPPLYMRPLKEIRFQGFIANHMTVTEHGFAYMKVTPEMLEEFHVDVATGGNLVNHFNFIDEVIAWGIFTQDNNNNVIRASIRSRGPIINEAVSHFGGGGHIFASGAKMKSFDEVDELIEELNGVCCIYLKDKE